MRAPAAGVNLAGEIGAAIHATEVGRCDWFRGKISVWNSSNQQRAAGERPTEHTDDTE